MKKIVSNPVLKTWDELNAFLMSNKISEAACNKLIQEEKAGRNRPTFLRRIHSRLNKLRADRERLELVGDK